MAELQAIRVALRGRQAYHLDVPKTPSAAALSVVSFLATGKMGEPKIVRIVLTHPLALARADYPNRDAAFSITPDHGVGRKFSGFIERFSTLQTTKDFVNYEVVLKHRASGCGFRQLAGGGESVPLRVEKPFAGKPQTGMHFVALDEEP